MEGVVAGMRDVRREWCWTERVCAAIKKKKQSINSKEPTQKKTEYPNT